MFYGYIVVVNPKPFTSSNCSTFVKTCNCRVHPTSKGQHTQLRTSHLVHSLNLNSNVRGTESMVIGPSHKFFHYFFSCSHAPRLTGSRSQARQIPTCPKQCSIPSILSHAFSEELRREDHATSPRSRDIYSTVIVPFYFIYFNMFFLPYELWLLIISHPKHTLHTNFTAPCSPIHARRSPLAALRSHVSNPQFGPI